MYIRLAFAVAAHLEPEILIVDEVLAVGDASFQQKCLGKMRDVSRTGRTVLFVSHNMQAVTMLCTRALLLNQGQVVLDDKPLRIVESYLHAGNDRGAEASWDVQKAPGNDLVRLTRVHVVDDAGRVRFDNDITKPINVAMEFSVLKAGAIISPSFHVHNGQGACLFAVGVHLDKHRAGLETPPGKYRVTCRIPAHFFNDGKHYVSAFLVRNNNDVVVNEPEVLSFMTHDYGEFRGGYTGKIIGAIRPFFPWDVERIGELS
jgi:lipopolysaccharide transport system ATP-binding protein